MRDKIKYLYKNLNSGSIIMSSFLEEKGVSRSLQKYYLRNGWLEAFGRGAYKKPGDSISWQSALNAIQEQTDLVIHAGANTALAMHGFSHYLRLNQETFFLFTPHKKNLPKWFVDANWDTKICHKQTEFLPQDMGLTNYEIGNNSLIISSPERAIMECLYLSPKYLDLTECFHLMEGLVNLKPKLLTDLLLACASVQVKRLFLYMAEKANHQWLQYIKTEEIDLGNGNRMLSKNGIYVAKYQLSVPKELAEL